MSVDLSSIFDIGEHEFITLVGAGGKTSLLYRLSKEIESKGLSVIITTSTKIFFPKKEECEDVIIKKEEELKNSLPSILKRKKRIVIGTKILPNNKIDSLSTKFLNELYMKREADVILCEGDGAKGRFLKAPNLTEPIIPKKTTLLIPVLGLNGIGNIFDDNVVFRPRFFEKITNIKLGEIILEEKLLPLFSSPEGIMKGSPSDCRIIPFFNQADEKRNHGKGQKLAKMILESVPSIKKVIIGSARNKDFKPVVIEK